MGESPDLTALEPRQTRSLCAVCKAPVEATVRALDGQVFLEKSCPEHGDQRALLSSSVQWYAGALAFSTPGDAPENCQTELDGECPLDCGYCPSHVQDVRLPVLPITSACNQNCPVCYTINKNENAHFLSDEEMESILQRLSKTPQRSAIINFTGGEPTLHPRLPEFLQMCKDHGVRRLTVSTNGKLLTDEAYVARMAELDVRVVLSLDTFHEEVDRKMLGRDTVKTKLRALELLGKHGVTTTILPAVARGYNDGEVGDLLRLVLDRPHICSLELHTLSFTGQGGAGFPRQARITVPDLHRLIDEATVGEITGDDFVPSPLAHPHCYSICYLLRLDDGGYVPMARLLSPRRLYELLGDSLYMEANDTLEEVFREVIDTLWADPDRLPQSEAALRTIKGLLKEMFPTGELLTVEQRQRIAERSAKAIYIHSHMDEETFDAARMPHCCVAVPETDGRYIPTCAYNVLYRQRDPRFASPEVLAGARPS